MSVLGWRPQTTRPVLLFVLCAVGAVLFIYWNLVRMVPLLVALVLGFEFMLDQKRIKSFFSSRNAFQILCVLLAATSFVLLLVPYIVSAPSTRILLSSTSIALFAGLSSVLVLLLIFSWNWARGLWKRYRNTWRLENPSLLSPDYVALFIFFSVLLILVFQRHRFPAPSSQFLGFVTLNLILVLGWFLTSFHWREKQVLTQLLI